MTADSTIKQPDAVTEADRVMKLAVQFLDCSIKAAPVLGDAIFVIAVLLTDESDKAGKDVVHFGSNMEEQDARSFMRHIALSGTTVVTMDQLRNTLRMLEENKELAGRLLS